LTLSFKLAVVVMGFELESVTDTTNDLLPAVVGVPEIVPEELRLSPAGRLPLVIAHVYGVLPPVAARAWL
jgi:hypothetical protein